MIDQTRFFVTQKYKIAQNVATGIINANDLVITSDTHELFYIDASGNYYPITTTKEEIGLENVTNTKQVNAPTNITPGHVAAWGSNSQTLYDSGFTIASNVPSNAKFTDTTYNVATPSSGGLMSGADKEKLDTIARGAQVNITYNNATQSVAGLMSATDKAKLDGIEANAQVNLVYSNATQNASGLMSAADKTKLDGLENITPVTYENATRTTAGLMSAEDKVKLDDMEQVEPVIYDVATQATNGLMSASDKVKLDGLEKVEPITYEDATITTSGLMSATDKTKLNGIESGAQVNVVYENATTTTAGLMSASDKEKLDGLENYELNIQDEDVPETIARKTDLIPAPPMVNGDYTLKATVKDGEITYTWIEMAKEPAKPIVGEAVVGETVIGESEEGSTKALVGSAIVGKAVVSGPKFAIVGQSKVDEGVAA